MTGDLVIIKEVMQHWTNEMVKTFLRSILPNFRNAIIVNDAGGNDVTKDTCIAGFHYIDVRNPPFDLPARLVFNYGVKRVLWWERK